MDGLKMKIDKRAFHGSEWKMKAQEGMVNECITLDASMVSEESINDKRSTKQHDRSSSSGYAADAERA
ncbi:hypothetical protein Tco_1423383 [Tanacetum coccineum]